MMGCSTDQQVQGDRQGSQQLDIYKYDIQTGFPTTRYL